MTRLAAPPTPAGRRLTQLTRVREVKHPHRSRRAPPLQSNSLGISTGSFKLTAAQRRREQQRHAQPQGKHPVRRVVGHPHGEDGHAARRCHRVQDALALRLLHRRSVALVRGLPPLLLAGVTPLAGVWVWSPGAAFLFVSIGACATLRPSARARASHCSWRGRWHEIYIGGLGPK